MNYKASKKSTIGVLEKLEQYLILIGLNSINPIIKPNKPRTFHAGLCGLVYELLKYGIISKFEYERFRRYFNASIIEQVVFFTHEGRETNRINQFIFMPYEVQPRLDWVQKKLQELKQ